MADTHTSLQKTPFLTRFAERTLFAILLFFPFCMILSQTISILSTNSHDLPDVFWIVAVCWAVAFFIGLFVCKQYAKTSCGSVGFLILIFLLAFAIRIAAFLILKSVPQSDFLLSYAHAVDPSSTDYEGRLYLASAPYFAAYSLILRLVFFIFPPSIAVAQLFNCFITACIPLFLYATAQKIWNKRAVSALCALFYTAFPSMVLYSVVLSTENLSQFFLALAVMLLAYAYRAETKKKQMLYFAGAGTSFAFMQVFKPVFIFIAAALAVTWFLYFLLPFLIQSVRDKHFSFKKFSYLLACFAIIYFTATIFSSAMTSAVQKSLDVSMDKQYDSYVNVAYQGLCKAGQGVWNPDVKQTVKEIRAESESLDDFNGRLWAILKSDYENDFGALFELLQRKFTISWVDDVIYFYWTNSSAVTTDQVTYAVIWIGSNIYYLIMCGLAALGFLLAQFQKRGNDLFRFFLSGIFFVTVVAFLIVEAQGRYRSTFIPILCVLSTYGFYEGYIAICKLQKKLSAKN